MTEAEDRWQFACYAWLGVPPAVIGAAMVFYGYGMASLVDPRLVGQDRLAAILGKLFPGALMIIVPIALGLGFFGLCMAYAATGKQFLRPSFVRVVFAALLLEVVPFALWQFVGS